MTELALRMNKFRVGYRQRQGVRWLLDSIDLELPIGEVVLLLGPSGGGKSTLTSALLGLDDPFSPSTKTGGQLEVLGVPIDGPLPNSLRGRVGAVFQDGALIDDLSVRGNIELAIRELSGHGSSRTRTDELLTRVGLAHPPNSVAALSGGQRKRVALARALAGEPELLILDEPTAGLDSRGASEVAHLIRNVHDSGTKPRTTIVITHDIEAFRSVAHRALFIDPRAGALQSIGIVDLDEALGRMVETESIPAGPPAIQSHSVVGSLGLAAERSLLGVARVPVVAIQAVRHAVPYHLGMVSRAVLDQILSPALYLAIAGVTAGGLATNFAIDNNPLDGAFRREVLLGTGKVLVSIALPLLVGVLFAARTAAGSTARLGGFRRNRVFEALPLLGVSPAAFLLIPLVFASVIGAIVQTGVGIVSGSMAGLWVAQAKLGISEFAWASATFASVEGSDFQWAAAKATLSGLATALTCYALAATPKHSQTDVATSTNAALVISTLLVLVIHGALTVIQFL